MVRTRIYGSWFSKRSRTDPLAAPIAEHLAAKMRDMEKATTEALWQLPPPPKPDVPMVTLSDPPPAPETPAVAAVPMVEPPPEQEPEMPKGSEFTFMYKRRVVAEAKAEGASPEDVRRKYNIPNSSFYAWMKKPELQPGSTSEAPENKVGRNYTPEFKARVVADMALARASGVPGSVLDVLKRHGISEQTGYSWMRAAEVKPGRWGRGSALDPSPAPPAATKEEPVKKQNKPDSQLKPGDRGYIYPEEVRRAVVQALKEARENGTPDDEAMKPFGDNKRALLHRAMEWAREWGVSIKLSRVDLPDSEKALWLGRWEQSGMTAGAFAAKHAIPGMSANSLRRWKASGLKPSKGTLWRDGRSDPRPATERPRPAGTKPPGGTYGPRLMEEANEAFARGEKVAEISARLGVPAASVYAWRVKWKKESGGQGQLALPAPPPAFPHARVRGLPVSTPEPRTLQPARPAESKDKELNRLRAENATIKAILTMLNVDLNSLFKLGGNDQ